MYQMSDMLLCFRRYESESSGFLSFVPLSFSWDQKIYDRDGLHLNVAGYDKLGEDVAAAVKKYTPKAMMWPEANLLGREQDIKWHKCIIKY